MKSLHSVFCVSVLVSLSSLFTSCTMKKEADLLLYDGKIYTVDSAFKVADAMVIKDGKVVATGSNDEMRSQFDARTEIKLNGDVVYPGFIDAHSHFYGLAIMLQQADLFGSASFEIVVERLKLHRMTYEPKWLLGRGWDQTLWENKEMPDNEMLDKVFPDIPVVITRVDGHAVVANSKALEMAGITTNTVIDGGKLEIRNGKLSGLLLDKAADFIKEKVPTPSGEELSGLLVTAQENCFGSGLTTVTEAGLTKEVVLLIEKLQNEGILKICIYAMLDPSDENIEYFVQKGKYKRSRLNAGAIKMYADGALGSRGACLLKPYTDDPENNGIMVETPVTLEKYCRIAFENNFQVCVHAIGDSAVRTVLNVYAKVLGNQNDRRWRVEHAQVVDESDFQKFGKFSIIPSVQPTHAISDMRWAAERLGPERVKNAYAYKMLLRQNGWMPLGTDFPIEKVYPLHTFYSAVFRKNIENLPNDGFQIENAISREDALRGITIWAAKACFEENEKGSLEPGKYADFVILDKDIMTSPESELLSTDILKTFVRGEKVYSKTDDGN